MKSDSIKREKNLKSSGERAILEGKGSPGRRGSQIRSNEDFSGISPPYNFKRNTHLSPDLRFEVEDVSEVLKLEKQIGRGFFSRQNSLISSVRTALSLKPLSKRPVL